MLISMVEFANIFFQKRRSCTAVIAFVFVLLFLAPMLQAHAASIKSQVQSSYNVQEFQNTNESPNIVTNAMSEVGNDSGRAIDTMKGKTLSSIMWFTSGITYFEKSIAHGAYDTTVLTLHSLSLGIIFTTHLTGDSFTFTGHIIGNIFGFFSGVKDVNSIIRPTDHSPTPTITQIRAQQATIIQNGTIGVTIPSTISSIGGECDNGEGNGGYPMSWCNKPIDTIPTIFYSTEPINRECTSYAFWYFTYIEGQTGFRAWGNAKYWATTSNYPIRTVPAVGAIAVETAGAYGHVAIVQALPGQENSGQVIPAGYVLVSEMNYDWHGHFRYSYSPLSKFTSYIYP